VLVVQSVYQSYHGFSVAINQKLDNRCFMSTSCSLCISRSVGSLLVGVQCASCLLVVHSVSVAPLAHCSLVSNVLLTTHLLGLDLVSSRSVYIYFFWVPFLNVNLCLHVVCMDLFVILFLDIIQPFSTLPSISPNFTDYFTVFTHHLSSILPSISPNITDYGVHAPLVLHSADVSEEALFPSVHDTLHYVGGVAYSFTDLFVLPVNKI